MTTDPLIRTIQTASIAVVLAAPAFAPSLAQAKPLEMQSGPADAPSQHAHAIASSSAGSTGWVVVAIGIATIVVLIGLAVLGARMANRRAVEA
jgi:hypothetical protein